MELHVVAETVGEGEWCLPAVTASASRKDGKALLTVANLRPDQPESVAVRLPGIGRAQGRVLTGAMDQYNSFDDAPLAPKPLEDLQAQAGVTCFTLPPCSVAAITLEP